MSLAIHVPLSSVAAIFPADVFKLCWRIWSWRLRRSQPKRLHAARFFRSFLTVNLIIAVDCLRQDPQMRDCKNLLATNAPENGQHSCPIFADHDRFRTVPQVVAPRQSQIFERAIICLLARRADCDNSSG
jgi:hypothetical protein